MKFWVSESFYLDPKSLRSTLIRLLVLILRIYVISTTSVASCLDKEFHLLLVLDCWQ